MFHFIIPFLLFIAWDPLAGLYLWYQRLVNKGDGAFAVPLPQLFYFVMDLILLQEQINR